MDNFREWISDNLRYIMLIVAVAVIVALAFFGIRFATNRAENRKAQQETAAQEEAASETAEQTETSESLVPAVDAAEVTEEVPDELRENDPIEVGNLIRNYYAALSDKDVPALRELVDVISDDEVASIITGKSTTFSSVSAYMKKGLDPDTYVAYAYYRYSNDQVSDIPGLSQLYVIKNDSGEYIVKSEELTENEQALVDSLNSDPEVQQLIYRVQREYEEAMYSVSSEGGESEGQAEDSATEAKPDNEDQEQESSEEESEESESSESDNSSDESEESDDRHEEMSEDDVWSSYIVKDCNVRSKPSYKGKVLGVIKAGTEVTVYGNARSGWYHISGGGFDGYVGHSFVN